MPQKINQTLEPSYKRNLKKMTSSLTRSASKTPRTSHGTSKIRGGSRAGSGRVSHLDLKLWDPTKTCADNAKILGCTTSNASMLAKRKKLTFLRTRALPFSVTHGFDAWDESLTVNQNAVNLKISQRQAYTLATNHKLKYLRAGAAKLSVWDHRQTIEYNAALLGVDRSYALQLARTHRLVFRNSKVVVLKEEDCHPARTKTFPGTEWFADKMALPSPLGDHRRDTCPWDGISIMV